MHYVMFIGQEKKTIIFLLLVTLFIWLGIPCRGVLRSKQALINPLLKLNFELYPLQVQKFYGFAPYFMNWVCNFHLLHAYIMTTSKPLIIQLNQSFILA